MKNKLFLIISLLLLGVTPVAAQNDVPAADPASIAASDPTFNFPSAEKRFERFLKKTAGPGALVGAGIGSTFQQIGNAPPEWEKTTKGFFRRYASNLGENALEQTTEYALSEALGQDPAYSKCGCGEISKRTIYALKSGFTARNRRGKTVFSAPKLVAPFAGSITAVKVWYPKRYSVQDGVRRGSYGFAFNVGFNLIREFVFK
ncbi:MAG: hypothetical protein OEM82_06285 [Acidobacteriota bacterium]|nr:hypothetical protein [Acidobacteriota bacterium]MDH3530571.1 hypothetical protein [Acidobacteriota bacterium]